MVTTTSIISALTPTKTGIFGSFIASLVQVVRARNLRGVDGVIAIISMAQRPRPALGFVLRAESDSTKQATHFTPTTKDSGMVLPRSNGSSLAASWATRPVTNTLISLTAWKSRLTQKAIHGWSSNTTRTSGSFHPPSSCHTAKSVSPQLLSSTIIPKESSAHSMDRFSSESRPTPKSNAST